MDQPYPLSFGTDEHDTRASRLTLLDLAALYRNVPQRYALGVLASEPPAAAGRGLTPRFTIVDETHSMSPAALERLAWRLPRESGDLFADLRSARGALTTARTDAQLAAVKVRMESLQARLEVQMAPLRGFVDRLVTDLAGSVQAAALARARALESRRNRNTGPPVRQRPPRRVDPRGGLYR